MGDLIVKKDRWAKKLIDPKISVIMPVYNEEKTVKATVEGVIEVLVRSSYRFEIIIVESNSTDRTAKILEEVKSNFDLKMPGKIKLINQEIAKGKGNAVREGLKNSEGDIISIYDADDEYEPDDILTLVNKLSEGSSSFVLGTRHSKGQPMRVMTDHPVLSRAMNLAHYFFTFIFNIAFKVNLTDPFTMHKVFLKEILSEVHLVADRFDIDWEILGKAIVLGASPIEISITYRARSYAEGKKVRLFLDPFKWLIILFKIKLFSFKPIMQNPGHLNIEPPRK